MGLNISGSVISSSDVKLIGTTNVIQRGLVLHLDASTTGSYPGSGTNWYDLSSNLSNGVLTNGPTYDSTSGGNITFDGSNDMVWVNNNVSNLFSNTFTQMAWVYYLSDTGTYQGIFWGEGAVAGGSGYQMLLSFLSVNSTSCSTHCRVNNSVTGWSNNDNTLGIVMTNSWKHVAWSFNNGTTKMYLNGSLQWTDTSRGSYVGGTSSPFVIGGRNDAALCSNMRVANVLCYNRTLTDSEILQNYNIQKSRFGL